MARRRRKSAPEKSEIYTLVRGADGALYLISETGEPWELKGEDKKEAMKILDDCEDKLSKRIEKKLVCELGIKNVHVGVPTVFVKHR